MDDTTRLRGCLSSIGNASLPAGTEIIVTGNGTPSSALDALQEEFPAIRILRSPVNRGFAGGHMLALSVSRGEFFLFLNDDVTVHPDWVEKLLATIATDPAIAAVGSRLLFPDGRIQEAGMSLWQDGATIPIGRGLPGTSLTYDYRREVDYCSACSLLVRRSALMDVGGMSDAYYPAYYEDADLALRLRTHGYRIVYEPQSTVTHEESKSTTTARRHLLLERNRERFFSLWKEELLAYDPPPARPEALPLARALVHALWRARGYPVRAFLAVPVLPDPEGTPAEQALDSLLTLLHPRCAITLALPEELTGRLIEPASPLFQRVRSRCQDQGIQLLAGSRTRHLTHPDISYDLVIGDDPDVLEEAWQATREHSLHPRFILDCRLHGGTPASPANSSVPVSGIVEGAQSSPNLPSEAGVPIIPHNEAAEWYAAFLDQEDAHDPHSTAPRRNVPSPHGVEYPQAPAMKEPGNSREIRVQELALYADLLERAYHHATAAMEGEGLSGNALLQRIPYLRTAVHAVRRARGERTDPPFPEWEGRGHSPSR